MVNAIYKKCIARRRKQKLTGTWPCFFNKYAAFTESIWNTKNQKKKTKSTELIYKRKCE